MRFELVVVGTSLGGLRALEELLSGLPPDFPLPIAIVQHRGAGSSYMLRDILQTWSALPVEEAEDKMMIAAGHIYLAPAGYHLLVDEDSFSLSTAAPIQYSRPSIDVLFESAAQSYGSQVIGVVLTGANRDGAVGSARIKEQGGCIVVQEPATAESRIMPEATISAVAVDHILPLSQIAAFLTRLCSLVEKSY